MTAFVVQPDEEAIAYAEQAKAWAIELAWHSWLVYSCIEFNSGHDLRLQLEPGGYSELVCGHGCPIDIDDFYPDGWDLVGFSLPVSVEVETIHYPATPDHSDEYDVRIELVPRWVAVWDT